MKLVYFHGFMSSGASGTVESLRHMLPELEVCAPDEGFGRMTAEANMLGIPVIGRNTGGTKEILELTKGGFLFDTVEEMARYMNEISSKTDSEICEFMAKPRQIAIDSFSTEQHVKKVLNLYNSIIKKTNRE